MRTNRPSLVVRFALIALLLAASLAGHAADNSAKVLLAFLSAWK